MPFPNVKGLRLHDGIMSFEFLPTIGILARDMDVFGTDIQDFRNPLERAVREVMIPSIQQNFRSQGRPAWEPLSDATLMLRDKEGTGSTILNRSGDLERGATSESIWTITNQYAIIKDLPQGIWYGKVHQAGVGGMRTRMKNEMAKAKAKGIAMSPSEGAAAAQKSLDKDLLAGKTGGGKSTISIPARPFVMFQPEDYVEVERIFDDWMGGLLQQGGWS